MSRYPVIALLVAYGPETRSFLQSGLAERLATRSRALLTTPRPDSPALKIWGGPILAMPEQPEGAAMRKLRAGAARVRGNFAEWGSLARGAERFAGNLVGGSDAWAGFYRRHHVDAVVTASYSSARTLPALQSANNLGLKTIVLLNSFKDVYTQPYAGAPPSALSVFGDREAERFRYANPEYAGDLRVGGSLHLAAVLSRRGEIGREELCQRLRLDVRRPIVTYCAAAPGSSEDEVDWVRRIAHEAPMWPGHPQLLVRGNPMDETHRFDGVEAPVWRPAWEWRRGRDWCCPAPHDAPLWSAALEQSALCISSPSTVTTEFVAAGKPVLNLCGPEAWRRLWFADAYADVREQGWATSIFDMAELRSATGRALDGQLEPPRPDFMRADAVGNASAMIESALHLPPANEDPVLAVA